jgi:hypothetical protein
MSKQETDAIVKLGIVAILKDPDQFKKIITGQLLVPSLDGSGKMSKSGNPDDTIWLNDSKEEIERKIDNIPDTPENACLLFNLWWIFHEKERDVVCWMIAHELIGNIVEEKHKNEDNS